MAVVSCERVNPRNATFGLQNQNTYRVQYRIWTDITTDDTALSILQQAQALASPNPLPQMYSTYAGDPNAFCTNIEISQSNDDEKRRWDAVLTFGPLPPGQDPADFVEDPRLRPTKWQVEYLEELRPIGEYYDGTGTKKLLRNGAGQEFIDPIMQEVITPVLVGLRNLGDDANRPIADPAHGKEFAIDQIIEWNLHFQASVNETTFRGGAPRTVRWLPIQAGGITNENGYSYYPCAFRFAYDPETWDRRIVNQGFYYRDGLGLLQRIVLANGDPVVEPVCLKANGTLADPVNLGPPAVASDSVLVRNTRPLRDYTVIGL